MEHWGWRVCKDFLFLLFITGIGWIALRLGYCSSEGGENGCDTNQVVASITALAIKYLHIAYHHTSLLYANRKSADYTERALLDTYSTLYCHIVSGEMMLRSPPDNTTTKGRRYKDFPRPKKHLEDVNILEQQTETCSLTTIIVSAPNRKDIRPKNKWSFDWFGMKKRRLADTGNPLSC